MGRKRIELAGLRVLVADSQWLLAHETVDQLHREGVEVEGPVATVQAAIDIVHRSRLDAAVVEAGLRGGDLAALRALLAQPDAYEVVTFDDARQAPPGLAQLAPAW